MAFLFSHYKKWLKGTLILLFLVSISFILLVYIPKIFAAESALVDDNFQRANTSAGGAGTTTGVGNGWIDVSGNIWSISSNKLFGNNVSARYRQYLIRPSSEDRRDSRIVVKHLFQGNTYALLRANPTTYDSYAAYMNNSNQLKIVKINGNVSGTPSETSLGTASFVPTIPAGTIVSVDFSAINSDSTHTNLNATLSLASNSAVLATSTVTGDTSSNLQSTGSYGVSNYFSNLITQITTYDENAPNSTAISLTGPSRGQQTTASNNFTVSLSPQGSITSTTVVTPNDNGAGGTFTPTTVPLSTGTQSATFTYTPSSAGTKTISITNNNSLTNPSSLSYSVDTTVFDDTFQRSNTQTGAAGNITSVGNNWIDLKGYVWNITSNALLSSNLSNRYEQYLLRPSTEDNRDARIKVKYSYNGDFVYALLRANPTTYDSYAAYVNNSGQVKIVKITGNSGTNGSETALGTGSFSFTSLPSGTNVILDFSAINSDSTHTDLSASVKLASNSATLGSTSVTGDISSNLQSAGSYGISNYFTIGANQITTYNESPTSATGLAMTGPTTAIKNQASTNFIVQLTPYGGESTPTTITPSDGTGGGTFTPSTVNLSSDATFATFTYTPSSAGTKTISITNNLSYANPAPITLISSDAQLVAGTSTFTSSTSSTNSISATAATGGTGAVTYQWYRSNSPAFTPGSGNIISGATNRTFTDSGLTSGTLYFYKLVATDSQNVSVTYIQLPAMTTPIAAASLSAAPAASSSAITLGFIGDSISFYTPTSNAAQGGTINPPTAVKNYLASLLSNSNVTIVNRASVGTTTADWLPSTSLYTTARTAFISGGVQYVFIMLGANDSRNITNYSQSTYQSNLSLICNDLVSNGFKVILNQPTYTIPGSFTNQFDENSTKLAKDYQTAINNLANGTTIIKGDTKAYEYFAMHSTEVVDGVHLNSTGVDSLSKLWTQKFLEITDLTPPTAPGSPSTNSPTSSTTQVWAWTAASDTVSGVANYAWRVINNIGSTIASGTTSLLTITTNLTQGVYTFFVKAIDNMGNIGTESSGSVTIAFPTPTPSPAASSTSNSSTSSFNPNSHSGWAADVQAGPNFVGTPGFINGDGDASGAMIFMSNDVTTIDVYVKITKYTSDKFALIKPKMPFPWTHGYNTVSDIYLYQLFSSFNGYPVTLLNKPVTVSISYDPKLMNRHGPSQLRIAYFDKKTGRWRLLPTKNVISASSHTISNTTKTLGYFAVVYLR